MYDPSFIWALGDNNKLQRALLLIILYWSRNSVGICFCVYAVTKSTERTDCFAFNFSSDNQHIFSTPIIKQSQITHTHALWLGPVVFVLLRCVRHSSSASFRLIVLHKLGTTGRTGAVLSGCIFCAVGCVECGGYDVDWVDKVGCGAQIGIKWLQLSLLFTFW